MLRRILATISVMLFLMNAFGCTSPKKTDDEEETNVIVDPAHVLDDRIAMEAPVRHIVSKVNYHDGYIYYAEPYYKEVSPDRPSIRYHMFKRINLTTGEVSSPCADPLCSHTSEECPFFCGEGGIPSIKFFDEYCLIQSDFSDRTSGRIYLSARRILYNFDTRSWVEIFKTDGANLNDQTVVHLGDYLYHVSYGARETRDGKPYLPCEIQRYNLKTGKEDVIYSHEYKIKLMMTGETRVYFYESVGDGCRFYSIDKNGNDLREEPTISLNSDYLYQNRMYSSSPPKDTYSSGCPLVMQDLTTGKITVIADENVPGSLCVTEDAVYYQCKDYYIQSFVEAQAVYEELKAAGATPLTEPYKTRLDEIRKKRNIQTAYLWKCDLDGSNPQMIMELPGAGSLMLYYYHDGYLYTSYEFYDTETGEPLGAEDERNQPCRINLATGEIEFLHRLSENN